jgi:hypothetical protein
MRIRIRIVFWKPDLDPRQSEKATSGSASKYEAGSGSASESKFRTGRGTNWSHGGRWTLTVETWRLNIEPGRVCRPLLAGSYHFDEELDKDPHQSEKSDPDPLRREKSRCET